MKRWLVVLLMVLIVASLSVQSVFASALVDNSSAAISGGTTLDQLVKANNLKMAKFQILEYSGGSSMKILFNGVEQTIVDNVPNDDRYPMVHYGFTLGSSGLSFVERQLFSDGCVKDDEEFWLIPDGLSEGGPFLDYVIVPVSMMPQIINSVKPWEGTTALIQLWRYPSGGMVIHNLSTNEVVYSRDPGIIPITFSDDHFVDDLPFGDRQWGWIHTEFWETQWIVFISQSEPDFKRMQKAIKLYEDRTGNMAIGPGYACAKIGNDRDQFKDISFEQYEAMCGVYTTPELLFNN